MLPPVPAPRAGRGLWPLAVLLLGLAGCGRLGYNALDGDGDGDGDGGGGGDIDASSDIDAALAGDGAPVDGAGGTTTIAVGGDVDDGLIRDGVHLMTGDIDNHIHMGRSAGGPSWGYFRFALPEAIPAGATIEEVRLQIPAAAVASWDDGAHGLRLFIEDSPDANPITDPRETPDGTTPGFARYPVATVIDWGPGGLAWPIGETMTSPDLSAAFQELIQAYGGLAQGARMQVWIRGEGYDLDATAATRDTSGGDGSAVLVLRWRS